MTDFEQSLVALGISAATAFSLPKSVGALYGLAFARAEPLAFDDFLEALEMSKGSVSQGLKFLQRMGALRVVYSPTDRRTPSKGGGRSRACSGRSPSASSPARSSGSNSLARRHRDGGTEEFFE